MLHCFYIFNRPIKYNDKYAFGVITEGQKEILCRSECMTKLKNLVANQEWKDSDSEYTRKWCDTNLAKETIDMDGRVYTRAFLSCDGDVHHTVIDDCPMEFVEDFPMEDKGYSIAQIHLYVPFITDCENEFFVNSEKYYKKLVKIEGLEWIDYYMVGFEEMLDDCEPKSENKTWKILDFDQYSLLESKRK